MTVFFKEFSGWQPYALCPVLPTNARFVIFFFYVLNLLKYIHKKLECCHLFKFQWKFLSVTVYNTYHLKKNQYFLHTQYITPNESK